jgi:hypothetical protein
MNRKNGKGNSQKVKEVGVYLDTGSRPAVQVDSVIWGRPRMKFVKDDDGEDFEFKSLSFTKADAPFGTPVINGKKDTVSVTNQLVAGEWHYTIEVTSGGTTYDTDEGGPPTGDRPVIRN